MKTIKETCYSDGKKIAVIIKFPIDKKTSPAVLLHHGYSGYKEEYDDMADFLCSRGFVTLQYDARGCGNSEGQKGRMMCGTEWLEDAHQLVTYLASFEEVDNKRIGISGCSMGGATTLYMAAMDERIKCAVAMAPYAYKDTIKNNWRLNAEANAYQAFVEEIYRDKQRTLTGEQSAYITVPKALGMNASDTESFFDERTETSGLIRKVPLESVYNSFFIYEPAVFASKINTPIMIIHGTSDGIIPIISSYQLIEQILSEKKLVEIEGGPHPLPTSELKQEVFDYACSWFETHLINISDF